MDEGDIVSEFKRKLCFIFGYDENLKFVGSAKDVPPATEIKPYLEPRDFLNFAIKDSEALEEERNRINCLGNCKRAIDSQVDHLIKQLGMLQLAKKQSWNIPRKMEFISQVGVVVPRILNSVIKLRNLLEHEFAPPSKQQVEDALDVATLFISYAELVRLPGLNWGFVNELTVRYDYDNMVFQFFEKDPSTLPEKEFAPIFSLAYGDDGFLEFYDFLVRIVPLMEKKGWMGEDI